MYNEESERGTVEAAPAPEQYPVAKDNQDMPKPQRTTAPAFHALDRTRLTIDAADFIYQTCISGWLAEETGIFVTLAALSAHGPIPNDERQIAQLLGVRPAKVRKVWPTISRQFHLTPNGWVLRADAPVTPRLISTARVSLRHLFGALVEFWGRACVYCGNGLARLAIEHINPKARGGGDELKNLTLACRSCNSRKGTKTAAEFGHPHIHDIAQRIQ